MRLKDFDVVIEPREVVFEHITANKSFTKTLHIKNVGVKSKRMELFRPMNKKNFKLDYKNPSEPVPSGMEIMAVITFETDTAQEYNDKVVVSIDNKEVDIPLKAFCAKPILKVDEIVNFGTQSANNKTISNKLKISNNGAVAGEFIIDYKGNLPISFVPNQDIIPAFSHIFIRVDFFTKETARIEEKIELKLKGTKSTLSFKVMANIMEKELVLLDSMTGQKIQRIDFGSCYYGCNLTSLGILFNSSPEKVEYVILLEENGPGVEIGAELSKSTNALKSTKNDYKEEDFCPVNKLISAFPNNGTLEPFEKRPIFFRFNPQFSSPRTGYITTLKPPQRRDYAVFLFFEQLGNHRRTELAITGTALPVLLKIEPNVMEFEGCEIGQKKEMNAVVYNDSELKSIKFKFPKVANYVVHPATGRIPPRSCRNVVVSFVPHQMGTFKNILNCEVIDKMIDHRNPLVVFDKAITQVPVKLFGSAIAITTTSVPKYTGAISSLAGELPRNFVPGTTPYLTNEVGLNVNTTVATLKPFVPKAAVQNSVNDRLHKHQNSEKIAAGAADSYKIAFPNDRAKSIAPYSRNDKYKTLLTGVDRYNYVDPDYAYTEEEREQIEKHKAIYKQYIDNLKFYRAEKERNKEFFAFNNFPSNGLKPGCGLKDQRLTLNDMFMEQHKNKQVNFQVNSNWQLLTTDEIVLKEKQMKNTTPKAPVQLSISNREKERVSVQLTPTQIYKIIVTPQIIDFGEVCVKSTCSKNLEFFNTLDQPIFVELENDCNELRQTSPLAQLIPPQTKGTFTIVFESELVQSFQRSISYRINYSYRHHIIVLGESKLPCLKLSKNSKEGSLTEHVVLHQIHGAQPDLCYRSNITIMNPYNATAEFTWMPIYGEQGTAFSIRPASGTIEPFKDIDCEIVWHGSYLAPLTGTFSLNVTGGESSTLTCEAKLGQTQLQFISRRANFGRIAINMTETKTFYLTNNGTHNAYFHVLDTKPIHGMIITPTFGMAALNTLTPIKVEMTPTDILKFDARVMIQIRGGKLLELRMGGQSEDPVIEINVPNFDFGGVFSGAKSALPFKLINNSLVKAKIEFNLKRYIDYSIKCFDKAINIKESENNYEFIAPAEKEIELFLIFSPTEVASYDFELPMVINRPESVDLRELDYIDKMNSKSEHMSEFLSSNNNTKTNFSRKTSAYTLLQGTTPRCRVSAIGLRHALKLSNPKISFRIPITYLEKLKEGGFYEAKSTTMTNLSHRNVKWCLDMRNVNKVCEDGIFKICNGSMIPFIIPGGSKSPGPTGEIKPNESTELKILFCPDKPGKYNCILPIFLNDDFSQPSYMIEINGELSSPEIRFDPEILIMKPVPLGMEHREKFFIRQSGYETKSKLRFEIAEAKALDGELLEVLSVNFVKDSTILPQTTNHVIELDVLFSSPKPISTTVKLKFIDEQNREFFYNVVVTADNSLFTCYAFLADHLLDYHIVLEEGHVMKGSRASVLASELSGEPFLRPLTGGSKLSVTRSGSPTFEMHASSNSKGESNNNDVDVIRAALNNTNNGLITPTNISHGVDSGVSSIFSKAQEPLVFPSNDTNSGAFSYEILRILQRWFRCNGWSNSINPVKIPESFRSGVSRKPFDEIQENMPQQDAVKRENKTIYEMIAFLSGRHLPAIPVGAPVPTEITERTNQFYWQHKVLLKFLEVEGGCIAHIKPDHLLDTNEFKSWLDQEQTRRSVQEATGYTDSAHVCVDNVDIPIKIFQLVSKKSWLDILLQLLKVCVLNRITSKSFRSRPVPYNPDTSFPDVKPDPLISNIYSIGERILLAWLNYCYANYKQKIWENNDRGGVPSTRWIVNFDIDLTDSLTLAATIGAYCPYIIDSHLNRMYMNADTAEKCFHNALIIIDVCKVLGLEYDINSLDITDPNPISMCLFCAYLYEKLPSYVPSATIEFNSPLHEIVSKQVKIANPSGKNIFYQASIIGPNAENFSLPNGNQVPINAKGRANLEVNFVGNNLKSAIAYLLLTGKKHSSAAPDPIVFSLSASIDELTPAKTVKLQTPLYKPCDFEIEVENPYDKEGEFKINIIESSTRHGVIRNPFNKNQSADFESSSYFKLPTIDKKHGLRTKQTSKSSVQSLRLEKLKEAEKKEEDSNVLKPFYSAFVCHQKSVHLEAKSKIKVSLTYLPLQLLKHAGVVLFTNDNLGEFLYNVEGVAQMPEPIRVGIDEKFLDPTRVKLIKSSKLNDNNITLRCFAGDKVDVRLLLPVCNKQREDAIMLATEMRMSEIELKRRKLHGVLSSKSLLESLESLILNKAQIEKSKEKIKSTLKTVSKSAPPTVSSDAVTFSVVSKNPGFYFNMPSNLVINRDEVKLDKNIVPLSVKFNADRPGTFSTLVELLSLPDDVRMIPIEFKVTENAVSDATIAYLKFSSCVFDSIVQKIPLKNNSENVCHYEVEIDHHGHDKSIFKGKQSFSVQPKEAFYYELIFTPCAEISYEAELKFNNITEAIQIKYYLSGQGERRPPLGEIKLETRVGQSTHHEIFIPNKSNKKICFYAASSSPFFKGPDKLMVLQNKREAYRFEIQPTRRGEFKGTVTFRPGEWPIKDIDSDGEEMLPIDVQEPVQQYTLWFTFDIKVAPPPPQSLVELEANVLDSTTLCIPLSNPFTRPIDLIVKKQGLHLYGLDTIQIPPKDKFNYELLFSPKQIGNFRGSLIFLNEEFGEFWYDLKLSGADASPILLEPIESEIGRYVSEKITITNPLNEAVKFHTSISNSNYFGLEDKKNEYIHLDANGKADIAIIFIPGSVGLADHCTLVTFSNEKIGNITYELKGVGLEPECQELINITSEVGKGSIVNVNFRNTTESAVYCDLSLEDKDGKSILNEDDENSVFSILLENLKNVYMSPKSILDIPVLYNPSEMNKYDINLVVNARREGRMSWVEPESTNKKIEELKWVYPIHAVTVVNAISKATPFNLECVVRKRLEKRMEVLLTGINPFSSDKSVLKIRAATPVSNPEKTSDLSSNEFSHSIQYIGNQDQIEIVKNSVAMKLVRSQKDKQTGLLMLVFDFIFWPSQSFINEAYLQIEASSGGMWRYPLKLVALEPPPDDTITIEVSRLHKEFLVGFKLASKTDESLPFKAYFSPNGDQVFTVYPESGELLPQSEDGTLIKVGFISPSYGKIYQSQLIISTPLYQWKYLVKGVTSQYAAPRGQSGLRSLNSRTERRLKKFGKKKNYVMANTYILQTAPSSPVKGGNLVPQHYSNF